MLLYLPESLKAFVFWYDLADGAREAFDLKER